ncbi:RagB/SusD family nutrient uptake outer membrane protein [Desertivirga arenae]|uniref:RagB/SusD family nutrient uptake outer membrane protein n=1 Tax=Desertivirga arenae TaxID=2810309 RepID=UPI001A95B9D3|nr:RagB/SusD family nutrient uptake outer membrane protein [Pedobacter sp. SYSU D00823]
MKRFSKYALVLLLILSTFSCKKFVEEELVSNLTFDYYKTDKGIEDVVESAYERLRWKFNGEQAYAMFNFGDDEFILGDQFNFSYYNTYTASGLNADEPLVNSMWIAMYEGINRCNVGIELLGEFNDPNSTVLGTEAKKRVRLGELHFLRAYYYFTLVQQFGGVPLVLQSSRELRTDFPRASVADVYKSIIADLIYAKDNLPPVSSALGRASAGTARHFLAKVYLTRASAKSNEEKANRGMQSTDLDSVIFHANGVITGPYGYALEADYMNLWSGVYPANYPNVTTPALGTHGTAPAGDYGKIKLANQSKEVILAAQFTTNVAANTTAGNRVHEYFIMQYDSGIPGLVRDQFNGRPFRRMGPSDYVIDIFDRKNDSRFYKSFRTAYYSNADAKVNFTASDAPTPALVGKPKFGVGDTAAFFIVNDRANAIPEADLGKFRYRTYARWIKAASNGATVKGFSNNKYLTLVKHLDPVRVSTIVNEESGVKNGILARLGETYLILAEAHGRKANYATALTYINKIRERAAYKAGEFRNPQTYKYDGATKGDVSSTYPALEATMTLFTTNAASELYPTTVSNTEDRFIHFILNERTRELCGELYRWEDLVRTETLFQRVNQGTGTYVFQGTTYKYNPEATSIQEHNKLRPIPTQQINLTTVEGRPMDPDAKKKYQNPGY